MYINRIRKQHSSRCRHRQVILSEDIQRLFKMCKNVSVYMAGNTLSSRATYNRLHVLQLLPVSTPSTLGGYNVITVLCHLHDIETTNRILQFDWSSQTSGGKYHFGCWRDTQLLPFDGSHFRVSLVMLPGLWHRHNCLVKKKTVCWHHGEQVMP